MLIVDCVIGTRLADVGENKHIEDVIFNVQPLTEPDERLAEACFVGHQIKKGTVEIVLASESGEEFALTLKLATPEEERMLREYLARCSNLKVCYLEGNKIASGYPDRFDVPLTFFETEKDMMVAAMEMRA